MMGEVQGGLLTERGVDICPDKSIATIAFDAFLAQSRDPSLRQTNTDIDLTRPNGRDHVPGTRGEGDKRGIEAIVFLSKVKRGREVLGHKSDAERY